MTKKEVAEYLRKTYPDLYADVPCGICVGEGWLSILLNLSQEIAPYSKAISVDQVKEKFGTLRFYISGLDHHTDNHPVAVAIAKAEAESAVTCENCGSPGTLLGRHWVRTLCEECAKSA